VDPRRLISYAEALRQYHLRPEAKFQGGDYMDAGVTHRRRVRAVAIEHIGKEADQWERKLYVGEEDDPAIEYGVSPEDADMMVRRVLATVQHEGLRTVAEANGQDHARLSRLACGRERASARAIKRLECRADKARRRREGDTIWINDLLQRVRERQVGMTLKAFAAAIGVNRSVLSLVLAGKRKPSAALLDALEAALDEAT
jgi:hypothetical protein